MNRPPLAMTWCAPHPDVRAPAGAEYATDGTHVYERVRDPEGRYRYRRALWSKVPVDVEWADVDAAIWEAIDETGIPLPGLP